MLHFVEFVRRYPAPSLLLMVLSNKPDDLSCFSGRLKHQVGMLQFRCLSLFFRMTKEKFSMSSLEEHIIRVEEPKTD